MLLALSLLVSMLAVLPVMGSAAAGGSNDSSVLTESEKASEKLTIKEGVADGSATAPVEIWNESQLLDFVARVNGSGEYTTKSVYISAILKADIAFNEGYTYSYDTATLLVKVTDPNGVSAYVGSGVQTNAGTLATWYKDTARTAGTPDGFVKPTEWTPIGTSGYSTSYKGTFNGNGHTVSGLFYAKNASNVGFIGYAGSDAKSGVNVVGLTIKNSCFLANGSVGAVVGYMGTNAGDEHTVSANVSGTTVGTNPCNHKDGTCPLGYDGSLTASGNADNKDYGIKSINISYCNNDNTIVMGTGSKVGGVVGNIQRSNHYFIPKGTTDEPTTSATYIVNRSNALNLYTQLENTGFVASKSSTLGGVLGYADFGKLLYLYNYGDVYGFSSTVAGVVPGGDNVSVNYLANYGNVTGTNVVSGVAGFRNRAIYYSFNAGNVTATNGSAAGIAYADGDASSFNCNANIGNVTATKIAAGIFAGGKANKDYNVKYSYNAGVIDAPKKAQLGYFTSAVNKTVNSIGSYYLEGGADPYVLENGDAKVSNAPTSYKASELASGELCEKLGTNEFHQNVCDSAPVPGPGRVAVHIEGDGSAENPFLIYNAKQLKEFAARVNENGYVNENGVTVTDGELFCAKLMADINLNEGFDFEFVKANDLVKVTDPNGVVAYIGTGYGGTTRGAIYSDTDLTANAPAGFALPEAWTPIGNTTASAYRGTFDGNGKTVSGLYINSSTVDGRGLFGYVSADFRSAVSIQNLNVANYCVISQGYSAVIAGRALMFNGADACDANGHVQTITKAADGSIVSNVITNTCSCGMKVTDWAKGNDGVITNGSAKDVSGLYSVNISGCSVEDGVISGTTNIAGIVGGSEEVQKPYTYNVVINTLGSDGEIESTAKSTTAPKARSRNGHTYDGNVNKSDAVYGAGNYVGGIVGQGNVGTYKNSTNYAYIRNSGTYTAGIAASGNNASFSYLTNYGDVVGASTVGGIIGTSNRGISYGFNAGNVTGTTAVGGIIGYLSEQNQKPSYSANVGNITATAENGTAAGIAGSVNMARNKSGQAYPFERCYNAGVITGANAAAITNADKNISLNSTTATDYKTTITTTECYSTGAYSFVNLIDNTVASNPFSVQITYTKAENYVTADEVANGTLRGKLGSGYGQSANMAYPVPAYRASLAGTDVTLREGILLNFYVDVSTHLASGVTGAELVEIEGKQYYKVTVEVDAKAMGDAQSVTVADVTFKSSVEDYAAGILGGNHSAETKAMVQAMLSYGAAAQNYFDYDANNLVGTPVTDTDALAGAEAPEVSVADEAKIFLGASLVLDGTMKLNVYFKGNVEITVDGAAAKVTNKEKYCFAEIAVTPENIDKVFEIVAGDTVVKYSPLNYLKNSVEDADLAEMVASIYAYSVAAEAYANTFKK